MTREAFDFTPASDASTLRAVICEDDVPIDAALASAAVAVAVITGTCGPSYRPVGAVMVIDSTGKTTGNLSSGCIERDVALHAAQAVQDGRTRQLRYGAGSPFRDLELPCGGALDIAIVPHPDPVALRDTAARLTGRQSACLTLGPVLLHIQPALRFVIFGKGPEARTFAALATASGHPVDFFSPDPETVAGFPAAAVMQGSDWPTGLALDDRTAVALFFHDHDWEPRLMATALMSPALYVGAQGSLRAHQRRCTALSDMGLSDDVISRIASPFGIIPSTRDPRTLAASVLAQVLDHARLQ